MSDILFPPGLAPRRVTWTLERSVATFESPLSFASQRVARSGARWRASIEMPPLNAEDTGLLNAWLDQISRADHVGIVPVFQNDRAGTDSEQALFGNPQPAWHEPGAFTGWSALNLTQSPVLAGRDLLVVANGATGPAAQARYQKTFTVLPDVPHTIIVDVPPQAAPGGLGISNGSGSSLYVDTRSAPAVGRQVFTVTSNDTGFRVQLYAAGGQTNFAQSLFGPVQVVRSYVVQTAASAGATSLTLIGPDASAGNPYRVTNLVRALKPGQFVTVRRASGAVELKRVRLAADALIGALFGATSVAVGPLAFEPALSSALAVNDRIVTHAPWCRMRLAEPNSSATIDAPMFGGFAFDLVEWFGA